MNDRYQFIDPIIKDERDEFKGLSLEKNNKSILRIFRLLSGTSKIEDKFCDKIYPMNINYFLMPFFKNNRFSQKCIKKLFPSDLKLNEISDLFKNVRHNRDFYDAIEAEIVNCLIARKQKRYIEAFLFLYRVLEGISYSIPLIYTAKSKSFTGSFKSLQKYISKNSNDGEISFFKKFIQEQYEDEDFYSSTIDIKMDLVEIEELRPIFYSTYKEHIKDEYISNDTADEEIKVKFLGFFVFMINIRNRYFHFLQGTWKKNIATSKIVHPDFFFKPIVDLGINWVSIIFFEVMKFELDRV